MREPAPHLHICTLANSSLAEKKEEKNTSGSAPIPGKIRRLNIRTERWPEASRRCSACQVREHLSHLLKTRRAKVSKGQSQPQRVATAFLISLHLVLGGPPYYQVLNVTRLSTGQWYC